MKRVVITVGDPAGCGPSITFEAIHKLKNQNIDFIVIGDLEIISRLGLYKQIRRRINFIDVDYPSVNIESIQIKESRILELENQLILIYIGSRSSSEMHKAVIENFRKGDPKTIKSLNIMKNCAKKMKCMINSDITAIGQVMNENWKAQKDLHPLMTTPLIKKAESISFKNNALGFKCNGAGGGGSITILSPIEEVYDLQKKFLKYNFTILPCKFCFENVKSVEI